MNYGSKCEYNPLKRVLMFRPGEELKKITIHTYNEFSFRDVVYWKEFQKEHDTFCDLLRQEKVEVTYLNDLLSKTDNHSINPNLVYVRDTCSITEAGYIKMRMAKQIRTSEPCLVAKALQKLNIPEFNAIRSPGLLEGGDFVYPDDKTLFIGYSPRSNEEGALQAAKALLIKKILDTVVLIPLPSWRVHLDGGLMFLDKDLILYHPAAVETFPARIMRNNEATYMAPLMHFITEEYNPDTIPITDNELYLFGANIVNLNRRKCIIYEWNERIIDELRNRNIEVLTIPGNEIARGGGGPHCMTLPILRKS